MNKYIFIEADTNDGDYISTLNEISEETLELILPVISAIKNQDGHNYCTSEYSGVNDKSAEKCYGHLEGFDAFDELVPYGGYGVHTICTIKILEVTYIKELL